MVFEVGREPMIPILVNECLVSFVLVQTRRHFVLNTCVLKLLSNELQLVVLLLLRLNQLVGEAGGI